MTQDDLPRFCTVCGKPAVAGEACLHGPAIPSVPPPSGGRRGRVRRTVLEILLDPRSIQWMLISGGLLLATGLVIWLASLGVFDNPRVIAAALGTGTALLLGAGWWIIRSTQMDLAGKAITLLACLIMPLNLWFYHSNELLTLDGNLWMAAAICCVLYAASALVVRDRLFVYVLMAGLAGTGMLILADMHRFAEIAAPSVLLVGMGLLAIHVERLFPEGQSPFSREKFGSAFFRSGHVLLAGGLMLVLGAQAMGWFVLPALPGIVMALPQIIWDPTLKLLAIGTVLAGCYGYIYSGLRPSRGGRYVLPAMLTLIWAELLGLEMLNFTYRAESILSIVALTSLLLVGIGRFVEGFRTIGGRIGNGLMLLAFISSTMLLLGRTLSSDPRWASVGLAATLGAGSLAAAMLSGRSNWRRGHLMMAVTNGVLAVLVLTTLSQLSLPQKFEIATVAAGVLMLITGHIGWYREQHNRDDIVSFNLFTGAILAGLPLLIAAVTHRLGGGISLADEMALLTVSSLMLMTGLMLQLRSTTVTGGVLLSLHVAILLVSAGWRAQLALGVYLFIGGSVIFLIGLALAASRDRLLALPQRFQDREGVFRVLAWR